MKAQDSDFEQKVRKMFSKAPFIKHLGMALEKCESGFCSSHMNIKPEHLQHDGVIHAGVLTTLADHTAGTCASTLIKENEIVLTSQIQINLLRPGIEKEIECHSKVLKAGRRLILVESEVFGLPSRKLLSKATVTLAVTEPVLK